MSYPIYITLLIFLLLFAVFTLYGTLKDLSPYGRHMQTNTRSMTLPAASAWLLFECPQLFAFALTFWLCVEQPSTVALSLFVLWQSHYLYRGLIYPLRRHDQGKRFPLLNVICGFLFNLVNGITNAYAVSHAEHLLNNTWFSHPAFMLGLLIAVSGWLINFQADSILINLRQDGSTGYKIPYGGFFRYVSSANYFGEILLWSGWALMSMTLAGWVFVIFTLTNLCPRAFANHRWYKEKFPDYPKNRKALIPFII